MGSFAQPCVETNSSTNILTRLCPVSPAAGTATTQTEEPDSRKQSANQKVADKPNTGKKQEESKEQGPFFYIGGTNGASLYV